MIKEFQGEFRWLSNFTPVKINIGNRTFNSVEHAYMSMKSTDIKWKNLCASDITPGKLKRASRYITLRPEWNNSFRLKVMRDLCIIKFNQQPFKNLLLATKDQYIQEGNMWNDKFFGVCLKTGVGKNHLGKIIMDIRTELKNNIKAELKNNIKA